MQDYTRNQKGCDWGVLPGHFRNLIRSQRFSSSTNEEVLNCIVQYSSKTPYLIVSGRIACSEDRKTEDFEDAYGPEL